MSKLNKRLKCASFFAGVGGIDLAFENTSDFETVYANEFDKFPAETFELNSKVRVDIRDIREIKSDEIPDFDVMLAGFPCQAFSVAGKRQGFDDEKGRGTLFFDLLRIIKDKNPSIVFLENVKNLANHDEGKTLERILDELKNAGYHYKYKILNAMDYGNIPQNRERIYIVAFKDKALIDKFQFPEPITISKNIDDIIDFNNKVDDCFYYTKGKFKNNLFEKLEEAMDDDRAIYQWRRTYVRKNKSGVIPTLTANQGSGGHNVCLVKTKTGIRKMTPQECFYAQGFPKSFKLPSSQSLSRLYKQAGNSVCIGVIERIAKNIIEAVA